MKTTNRMTRLAAILLSLLMLPAAGLASEAFLFDTPIPCERMTVDSVTISRDAGELTIETVYTLNETLTAEDKEGLELMSFNIMPDAESTEFPEGFRVGEMMSLDEAIGAGEMVAGASYRALDRWDASAWNGDTIYLRPYYKLLGEWGAPIVLSIVDAAPLA